MTKSLDHHELQGDLTLLHPTGADTAGARKREIVLQGKTLAGTLHTLLRILAQHEGSAADQKAEVIVYVNDGNDGTSPTEAFRIASTGVVTFAQTPAGMASDAEVTAAIAAHEAAADPHTGYQRESEKAAANGYASLDSGGKVPSAQLPAIAITDTFVVASQAAMLALTAETGDVAVRTDLNKCFILDGTDPTQLSHWQELLTPTDLVLSVAGKTGAVTLVTGDITVVATDRLLGRDTAGSGVAEELTVGGGIEFTGSGGIQRSALTGDVTASAGSNSTTIGNNVVTNAKAADVATQTIKGRTSASTGDPEDLTPAQAVQVIQPAMCLGEFNNTCPQNTTTQLRVGTTIAGAIVIPQGYIAHILVLSAHTPTAIPAGQSCNVKISVDGADQSGSFGTLQLTDTVTADEALPTSSPFVIDASSARKVLTGHATCSATSGNVGACLTVWGYMYKP